MSYINQQHQHQDTSITIAQAPQVPTYEIQTKPANTGMEGGGEAGGGGGGPIRQAQIIRQVGLQHENEHEHDMQEGEAGVMVEEHDVTTNTNDDTYENGDTDSEARMNSTNDSQHNITAGSSEMNSSANDDSQHIASLAGFPIVDGKSNKYPSLRMYYEFGPWVGRNRKAICVRCKHTSASSQPERLIKHLRRCVALSDEDKAIAEDLLLVSNANKKKKPLKIRSDGAVGEDYDAGANYTDDDQHRTYSGEQSSIISLPSSGVKRLRRDHPDRKVLIDQALVRFIVCCRIPLRSIHTPEFIEFARSLDPDYRLPSRETITNVLIPRVLNIL